MAQRRDRGLTAAEQDDYLQWLRESDPAHAALMAEQEATLGRLMGLAEWLPRTELGPRPGIFSRLHRA